MPRNSAAACLAASADDFDFYAAVLSTAFASRVGGHGAGFALAFRIDTIGRDALTNQVVLDGGSTTLRQTLVVLLGTNGVSVTDCNQSFEVDGVDLGSNLVKNLTAFRLQRVLVEVEECVGIQYHLGGRRGHDRRFGNRYTVTTGDPGCGRPEGVAPAQFVGPVHPNVAKGVLPIVDSLCGDCAGSRDGCESECQCDFGGFVHVSPRLS